MASSLFGNNQQNNQMSMISQFNQFKQSMAGKDANAVLNQLIQSGKVSQSQVDQATEMAKQFSYLLK